MLNQIRTKVRTKLLSAKEKQRRKYMVRDGKVTVTQTVAIIKEAMNGITRTLAVDHYKNTSQKL